MSDQEPPGEKKPTAFAAMVLTLWIPAMLSGVPEAAVELLRLIRG